VAETLPPSPSEPVERVAAAVPPSPGLLRVGLFGVFYPEFQKAGNSTTGFALLWASLPSVQSVEVFAPVGSQLPPGAPPGKIRIRPAWQLDSPRSLRQVARAIEAAAPGLDRIAFNIHLTSFGRRPWTNVTGLLLPGRVARRTGRRPLVFLHHLLETQDVGPLGYRPTAFTRWLVRFLERRLLRRTRVVVPLASQATRVEEVFGVRPDHVMPAFVEAVPSGILRPAGADPGADRGTEPLGAPIRVLLFGYWGPQKEVEGVLGDLAEVHARGAAVRVTVSGEVNVNFPEFAARLARARSTLDPSVFQFRGGIPETDVPSVLAAHDVLLLPYRATGGYSGAMNLAAPSGIGIVAYDLPQLRETASELGIPVEFIPPRDVAALERAIRSARTRGAKGPPPTDFRAKAVAAAQDLLDRAAEPRAPAAPVGSR
jgi:glycosyltransferase involved in cell wall biosynthesis